MGILLFFVSLLLSSILVPVGMIFGFYKQVYKTKFRKAFKDIDNKFMSMAMSIDVFGNVACAELFNATLIKNSKHLFGSHKQKISHVLGLNVRDGYTMTKTGEVVNNVLDLLDKDHSIESIED